jgi:small subunit ribosomal protein S14
MGSKSSFLRDMRKRLSLRDIETQRNAHLFVARNTTLPAQVRHRAQLALNNLNGGGEGRPGAVKNRCIETGRGRGIMSTFGLCRVSD